MKIKRPPITADDLRQMGPEALENALGNLSKKELEELQFMWEFWARDDQLEPEGKWKIWLALAGRGWGKTRTGAEWVRHRVKCGDKRIAAVAPTRGSVRQVMVEGPAGLLNICSKHDKTYRGAEMGFPEWFPTNNTIKWSNGAKVEFFSAEDPERLRGPQFESAWCDEICAWGRLQETWDMLQFCMRLGKNPKIFISTTPKPVKLIRNLVKEHSDGGNRIFLTKGSSYDNADNIQLDALKEFEGTRLGQQELYGEILMESEGALWNQTLLDEHTDETITDPVKFAEDNLVRVVVAVDPATSDKVESDMTGIVVAGVDVNGTGYVLEDATERYSPQKWAQKAVELYYKYGADRIVAERNQGGAMVKETLLNEDNTIPLRMVFASRGKMARAEPIAAMYERGKVKHAPGLGELEQQMVTWEPLGAMGSPDRLDAMVWALTDLMLKGRINPEIQILYSKT